MSDKPVLEDEDTKAILTRRALLIRASLAGAGLVVGTGAGCDLSQSSACLSMKADIPDAPEVCLLPDIGVCLTDVPSSKPDVPDVTESDVQVCLSRRIEDVIESDSPQVCLSRPPPDVIDTETPQICLSPRIEDIQESDVPQPCLSIALPDVQDTSDDDGPQICLKIAPDVLDNDGPQICLSPPAPDTQG